MPKVHKLKNNITLILDPNENSLLTSVLVGVSVGSIAEDVNQHGLAHFLEHMCFNGTKEYPEPSILRTKASSLGIRFGATTGFDTTKYYFTGNSKHTEEMIHIASEVFINQLFPVETLEKEKGIVIEEIKMSENNSEYESLTIALLELFKGTQAGHDVAGSIESVNSFERGDLVEFCKKHYVADNTTIVISGKFDEEAILKKVSEEFENARRGGVKKQSTQY